MKTITRRNLLKRSGIATGALALGLPGINLNAQGDNKQHSRKLKVIVTGAHPDDPETGCGGTMIHLAEKGHEVVALYLTRGEAGITGKTYSEAAQIRTSEAKDACNIMNARSVFAGQIDGSTEITRTHYEEIRKIFERENPDMVFTHWPIDGHRDHRHTSLLVYDAWLQMDKKFYLYYYEVITGRQTQSFNPDYFVDITSVEKKKRKACYCHKSQELDEESYNNHEEMISRFRGLEYNCQHAEAFIGHVQNPAGNFF